MSDANRRDAPDPIVTECDLDAPPETVWRALTEPEILRAWLEPEAIEPADDGRRFRLDFSNETVELEVLEEEQHRLLRYRWRSLGDNALPDLDSVVTFELSDSDAGGTHLRIVHDDFAVCLSASAPTIAHARRPLVAVRDTRRLHVKSRRGEPTMRLAA